MTPDDTNPSANARRHRRRRIVAAAELAVIFAALAALRYFIGA